MGSYYNETADYEYLPELFSSLTEVLRENKQYYSRINDGSKSKEFSQCFDDLLEVTGKTLKLLLEVAAVSPLFDYDHNTKGNGYRTIVRVVEMCFRRLHALGEDFQNSRAGFLFRTDHYYKEIVSYLDLSKGLFKFLEFAKLLLEWSHGNDLFPPENCYDAKTMTDCHLHEMEKECFYGRRLGFHFNTALRGFLTTVCISMASFGDGYAKHDGSFTVAAASLLNGPKYLINPDLRAKRLISLSTLVDMEFCKAFWSLTERYGFQHFPLVVSSALKVNELFEIPPVPIEIPTEIGDSVTIQPPNSWIGPAPVKVHLLSYLLRAGQTRDKDGTIRHNHNAKPKADGLVIHIHGGGFVAQSSKSHEIYLRSWAKSLNVPILSINYALAPELPFPRAMEECLFAYVWALKNLDRLGTTGKYIALVGDSAGGNLCVTLCLKASSYGIRLPDGILTSYAPFNVQFRPSPSRLLSLLDPLLPIGILTQCLAAYTGTTTKDDEDLSETTQAGTKTIPKKPDHFAPKESCCCEDVRLLPDVVQGSQSGNGQVSHASSEFDLVHSQMEHVCLTRSQSDSGVPRSSNKGTNKNELHHDVSSCGLLTDEHLITMAKNPYISPLVASNEQLAKLPPMDLLACTMDPLLDDSIEFAKRLRDVGNKVELYIVDDLPHGFLSFYMICQEGREANELCIACIKKILQGKRNVTELSTPPIY